MDSLDEDIARCGASSTFKELITIWNTGRLPAKGKQAADKTLYERGLLINILADYDGEAALSF